MTEFTKEEALAFVEAMRLTVDGKVGFKWMTDKLSGLTAYIDRIAGENERLTAFIDSIGAREDYESRPSR